MDNLLNRKEKMNINDFLLSTSECEVVIGFDTLGHMKLIKNGGFFSKEIKTKEDCFDILWRLFKQETKINFFNSSFEKEFFELLTKYNKGMSYYEGEIISSRKELRSSFG